MVESEPPESAVSGAWDAYWQRTGESASYRDGGPLQEALAHFWREILDRCRNDTRGEPARILDLACGNGAVTQFAVAPVALSPERWAPMVIGMDSAPSAVLAYRDRFPLAAAVVAEVLRAPFPDRSFGLVASQFGLEYGGPGAIEEAARLVAPGGVLAAVLHRNGGALHRECARSLAAIGRVRDSGLLVRAKEVFRRGTSALRGHGSQGALRAAVEQLRAAVSDTEAVLREFGEGVAGGAIARLLYDLAHMHGRLGAYDPAEVAAWAERMADEIENYAGRMAAMLGAGLDETQVGDAATRAASRGLAVRFLGDLSAREPVAWVLVCERPAATG